MMINYDLDDAASLGYCSDPQFSPEHNELNTNWLELNPNSNTWIEFTEQPADFRYRYLKEKYHGHIVGVSSPQTKKKDLCKFPKLKLNNYSGDAIVRVWLISTPNDRPRAHFHQLARKRPKGQLSLEPHDFIASLENNYEVTLDYLHIVHAVSNDENDINVYRKKKAHIESGLFDPPRSIPVSIIRDEKEEIKQIDKNQSYFYVEVFDKETHTRLCEPAVSNKIKNLHNAETAALRIVNCSRTFGSCRGNDEVFIFVEKISKDVQVRFFQPDTYDKNKRTWQDLAIYGPQHVHHQLGIVFRTPKFEKDVEKDTQVFFELYRKNDGAVSDPYPFTYKPHEDYNCNDMARKRPHSPEIMSIEEENNIPTVVRSYNSKRIKDESMSPDSTTVYQLLPSEPVNAEPNLYSMSNGDDLYPSIDEELAKFLLAPVNQDEILTPASFTSSTFHTEKYESTPWLNEGDVLYELRSSVFGDTEFDGVTSSEDVLSEGEIVADGVISSEDLPAEDSDNDLNEEEHLVSAIDGNPGSCKKRVKSERKSSHSSKLDLVTAIIEKIPIDEFKEVLKNTVNINAVDYEGNSALHYAVGSAEYLELILEREDLDKDLKNLWGDDALLAAARNGSFEVVKILLKNDFEPNVKNSRTGETPLHLAVTNEDHLMVELLLKHGADPFLDNHSSKSAYEYSMDCNRELRRLLQFLMQKSMFPKRLSSCLVEDEHTSEKGLDSLIDELSLNA